LNSKINIKASDLFAIDSDFEVLVLPDENELVPEIDNKYFFDKHTTEAILAGFKFNMRVLLHGLHGSGKSTHIEQIAARLNWPCIRINLDGHITRTDLIGRDAIVIQNEKQVTEFKEGILPWAVKSGIAIILDEYDAARPDVMFVLQRLLENNGKLTLIDTSSVITPHPNFRIFATSNTIGLGDSRGIYSGTNLINQAQMDRWNIVINQQYLPLEKEASLIISKVAGYESDAGKNLVLQMVELARLTRNGFTCEDISCLMSPRTVLNFASNNIIFNDLEIAFRLSYLNKCEDSEKPIIAEYYQRVFNQQLTEFIKEKKHA
jgi:cobaltochelatase CobS